MNSSRATIAKRALRTNAVRRSSTLSRCNKTSRALASAMRLRQSLFLPSVQYSTETALKLRGSTLDNEKEKILYDASQETENCGVGMIASLKSKPSRHVVEVADEMLVRMAHRGGCGCDPNSGDGAGKQIIRTKCQIETACMV